MKQGKYRREGEQLSLTGLERPWRLDEKTRQIGLREVAKAREIIRRSRRDNLRRPGNRDAA